MTKSLFIASYAAQLLLKTKTLIRPLGSLTDIRKFHSDTDSPEKHLIREFHLDPRLDPDSVPPPRQSLTALFTEKWSYEDVDRKDNLFAKVSLLKDELLSAEGSDEIARILTEKSGSLFTSHFNGSAFVELLDQLRHQPQFSMEVLNWRRQQDVVNIPMTSEEYAKGIMIAGRSRDVDLALDLFKEVALKGMMTTSTYNALMGAYMYNGCSEKCVLVFEDLKRDANCTPTIVTYNILISVFGRLMLVDQMEATFNAAKDSGMSPNLNTYDSLIAGYITAWMWDHMERTFRIMKANNIKPATSTYLLMLRGYAHSGNLEKMEDTYLLVKDQVDQYEYPLIRAMICAYCKCKSSSTYKVKRIQELTRLIPENEYRPWLNVHLIRLYAREDMLEEMENSIDEAFLHNTPVTTVNAMRCIVTGYFQRDAVDKLADFVKRAETAGWKICRTLYHSKMVMYASQKRLTEMEKVLSEMEQVNLYLSRKTFWILCNTYLQYGQKDKLKQVIGLMWKHGHKFPLEKFPSH